MTKIVGNVLDLRSVSDTDSQIRVLESATHNQSALRAAVGSGNQFSINDSGVYPILTDDFVAKSGTVILVNPGVKWSMSDGSQVSPRTLLPILLPTKAPSLASHRAVLFGDSMTSQYYVDTTPTGVYDSKSGTLVLTGLSNPVATGWEGMIFNRLYAGTKSHIPVVFRFID